MFSWIKILSAFKKFHIKLKKLLISWSFKFFYLKFQYYITLELRRARFLRVDSQAIGYVENAAAIYERNKQSKPL